MKCGHYLLIILILLLTGLVNATYYLVENGSFETGTSESWVEGDAFTGTYTINWGTDGNNISTLPFATTDLSGNYAIKLKSDTSIPYQNYYAYFNPDFDTNAHDFNQGAIKFYQKKVSCAGTGLQLTALINCPELPTSGTPQDCKNVATASVSPDATFDNTPAYITITLPDTANFTYRYFGFVFFVQGNDAGCYGLIDNFQYEVGGEVEPVLNSITQSPSPVNIGETLQINSLTTGKNQKLQCGLTETNPTGLCVSDNWKDNPDCNFTNTLNTDYNIFCRAINTEGETSAVLSLIVLTNPAIGFGLPTGNNKILFNVWAGNDTLNTYLGGTDGSYFEDLNGNTGYISLLAHTGEIYNIPTCNITSDCDVDLNAGQYTAIFYDSLFNIEYQKTFDVSDSNQVRQISIPMEARWFQIKFLTDDDDLIDSDLIKTWHNNVLGEFNVFPTDIHFNYKPNNTSWITLNSVNNYQNALLHPRRAFLLPYAQKWSFYRGQGQYTDYELIKWNFKYYYYDDTSVPAFYDEEKWVSQTLYYKGNAESTGNFNLFWNKVGVVGVKPFSFSVSSRYPEDDYLTPVPFINYALKDKSFYVRGDNIVCRAIVDTRAGIITNSDFKIVNYSDFSDINTFSGYISNTRGLSTILEHTFSSFQYPVEDEIACAFKFKNEIGMFSEWRFSQPFTMYADLNADINIVVRKTDGTIANPETDIMSTNSVFGKVNIKGEGLNRDFNAFSDSNHVLPAGYYVLSWIDLLDYNTTKKLVFHLDNPNETKLLEIVVGQSSTAPNLSNLKCEQIFTGYTFLLDLRATGLVYDIDGDLNTLQIRIYDGEHSANNPSHRFEVENYANTDEIYAQLLDEELGKPAKTCTQNNPCSINYVVNLIDALYDGNITSSGDNIPLFVDVNVIDANKNFTNQITTCFIDTPSQLIDENRSVCGFTTPSNLTLGGGGEYGIPIYSYLISMASSIPFSCLIYVKYQSNPVVNAKIYFQNQTLDINYSHSVLGEHGVESKNYYKGKVDLSDWGIGQFSGLKTKVVHPDYGTAMIQTSRISLEGRQAPNVPTPDSTKEEFRSSLLNLGENVSGFLMFMVFGFGNNPVGFFLTYFIIFVILIFLFVSLRGR